MFGVGTREIASPTTTIGPKNIAKAVTMRIVAPVGDAVAPLRVKAFITRLTPFTQQRVRLCLSDGETRLPVLIVRNKRVAHMDGSGKQSFRVRSTDSRFTGLPYSMEL